MPANIKSDSDGGTRVEEMINPIVINCWLNMAQKPSQPKLPAKYNITCSDEAEGSLVTARFVMTHRLESSASRQHLGQHKGENDRPMALPHGSMSK